MTARFQLVAHTVAAIRRHRRIVWTVRVLVACLIVSSLTDRAISHGDDWANFDHRQFTCVAAIDGQTISVKQDSQAAPTSVHLLGIASCTPHWDDLAEIQLTRWVGRKMWLKLEPTQTRDANGALLAYAFLDDQTTANAELARLGLALAYRPQPSILLSSVEQAEREARNKRRGLWNFVDNWEMPPWRQQWTMQERARRDKLLKAAAATD